ncbi:membrane protein [Fulvitalea axinellae]|uniref:Membrane protein n=1 Tax=Fulvitalea axinellae TaxID=1182444 RepID=A0AAU9CI38_9BACT|nr:membrane protein [Fulvitalea axinellae]
MIEWDKVLLDALWSSFAALGFAVLFNLPRKSLWAAGLLGAIGHTVRHLVMHYHWGDIVVGTLVAAFTISIIGMLIAHHTDSPSLIFSFCALIPMVPGLFAYQALISLISIVTTEKKISDILAQIALASSNGLKAMFVFFCLSFGVAIPILGLREIGYFTKKKYHRRYFK